MRGKGNYIIVSINQVYKLNKYTDIPVQISIRPTLWTPFALTRPRDTEVLYKRAFWNLSAV